MPQPDETVVINELVCEGCGDCSVESNCLSVEPIDTPLEKKLRINQSACNKDFSCLNGFCPSFITVKGKAKKSGVKEFSVEQYDLSDPALPDLEEPHDVLITGVGGTGVITVAALITMAAHLEGKGVSVLDFTGFAQKFGPVLSYVRLGKNPETLNQVRIDLQSADALIGCDIVVSSSPKASASYRQGMQSVMNVAAMPTGDVVRLVSERIFGDTVYANVIMLGFAWQSGLIPVSERALMQAIELNGVAIENNYKAFSIGRIAVDSPTAFDQLLDKQETETTQQVIERCTQFLTEYQSTRYAAKYRKSLEQLARHNDSSLNEAAARSLFKLMAYKDEYEVARLHGLFKQKLSDDFEDGYTVSYHMAPPLLARKKDARGRPAKKAFGQWMETSFSALEKMKALRGTPADVFGYTHERRMERKLIKWFNGLISQCAASYSVDNREQWLQIMKSPMDIRGYGSVKEASVRQVRSSVENLLP